MTIGENIKRIRIKRNMTQKELGEKLGGISQQQIGQWETGKVNPKIETIQKIAKALDVYLGDIYEDNGIVDLTGLSKAELDKYFPMSESEKKIESEMRAYRKDAIYKYNISRIELSLNKLNDLGQQEAVKRVEELTEIPRYTKKEE